MNKHNMVDKGMIFEHFKGVNTPLQKKQIEEWLGEGQNRELYYEWLDEWERNNLQFAADDKAAFEKINRIKALENKETTVRVVKRSLFSRFRLVAAVLLVVIIGAYLSRDLLLYKTVHTGFGETSSIILPDGTTVVLNSNSSLRYDRFGFGDHDREVFLKGEADFSVVHTKNNNKFSIKTDNDLGIVVLGTQFTVFARPSHTKVVLKNGKVELNYNEGGQEQKLTMKPGELFTQKNDQPHLLQQVKHPESMSAWKNGDYVFDETSLNEISAILKENYGVHLSFSDTALAKHTISGTLHADTAEELVDAISSLVGFNYKIKADTIYFVP